VRLFYASESSANAALGWSSVWYNNLYLSLADLGIEIVDFDFDLEPFSVHMDPAFPENEEFIEKNRPRLEEKLLEQIRASHEKKPIDVFFSYFYGAHCRPEVIRQVSDMGICTVNWYCNASYQFHLVKEIAPAYDYCLVPEKFRLDDYRAVGANPLYVQEAANPNIYKPYDLEREYDVTFVGQKYGNREEYLNDICKAGVRVNVWGPGWKPAGKQGPQASFLKKTARTLKGGRLLDAAKRRIRNIFGSRKQESDSRLPPEALGGPLSDEEMIKMYSRSRISLGFSACGETHKTDNPILQVRLRDFEAPMSGAFYMVEYMHELEEFFDIGKEIVCYHDGNDLAEKAKYYLSHESEREKIRQAGYRRAVNEHTWQKRFSEAFKKMGIAI